MKKIDELLDDDLAAFEEFDAPLREPAFKDDDLTAVQKTPPAEKPKTAKAKPAPKESEDVAEASIETGPENAASFDATEFAPDIPVNVVAVLAKKTLSLKDLFELRLGSVVDLGRPPSEYVDLVANGKLIGRGELVEIDGKLGVRIINLRTR